jgi:hypothetical protein
MAESGPETLKPKKPRMPATPRLTQCTVCRDYEVCRKVNRALINRVPYQQIARQFHLGAKAIERHARNHASKRLADAWKRREALLQIDVESLLTDLAALKFKLQSALQETSAREDPNGYASLARECRSTVESFASLADTANRHLPSLEPVKIEIVYGEDPRLIDKPGELPHFEIVRPQEPPAVEVQPEPVEPPKPAPLLTQPRFTSSGSGTAVVTRSENDPLPVGWRDYLNGRRM